MLEKLVFPADAVMALCENRGHVTYYTVHMFYHLSYLKIYVIIIYFIASYFIAKSTLNMAISYAFRKNF